MTKNYWVEAALHRKKAETETVLVEECQNQADSTTVTELLDNNTDLKDDLDRLLGEYLDNYRKLHEELKTSRKNSSTNQSNSTKLKSAM
ncbi:hypothetical protein [Vibrio apostichopi]|uniref:hypothetical protein n=1 Tax=Vibrio apostichopi TaxID=3035453 RepID=UPI002572F152|nr:hypothetical protein [Vibrio sp. FE10]